MSDDWINKSSAPPKPTLGEEAKPVESKPVEDKPLENKPSMSVSNNPFVSAKNVTKKRGVKVAAYGHPGTGKTHFSMGFPEPVYVIDTEGGSAPVFNNAYPDKQVFIVNSNEAGNADNKEFESDEVKSYENIKNAIDYLTINPPEGGTIVVDSATDLWGFCQAYAKVKLLRLAPHLRPKAQFDWGIISNVYKRLLARLVALPCNVVLLGRSQEIYEGPSPSGEFKAHLQKDTEYYIDVMIEMKKIKTKDGLKFYGIVKKARGAGKESQEKLIDGIDYVKIKELLTSKVEVKQNE